MSARDEAKQAAENEGLRQEIKRLRQGLWDIYAVLGFDTDGDPTPEAMVSDIVKLVVDAATETRRDQDKSDHLLDEAHDMFARGDYDSSDDQRKRLRKFMEGMT